MTPCPALPVPGSQSLPLTATRTRPMDRIRWYARSVVFPMLAIALAAIVGSGSSAPLVAAQAPAPPNEGLCQAPAGATSYRYSSTLRIYDAGSVPYGCILTVGRVVRLDSSGYTFFQTAASAGDYIGYAVGRDDFETSFYIRSLNTRTGRHVHTVLFEPNPGSVRPIVVKANGSIAWVQSDYVAASTSDYAYTVRLADTRGVRVPRHGRNVRRSTLRLQGSTLSWRKGRRRFTTQLH